jgi:hypothetical protein
MTSPAPARVRTRARTRLQGSYDDSTGGHAGGYADGHAPTATLERRPQDPPISELVGKTTEDLSGLFRAEINLAKAELKQEVTSAGLGAGALGVSAFLLYLSTLILAFAACWALAIVLPVGAAFGIIGGAILLVAAPLALLGGKKLRDVEPLPETQESLGETTDSLREAAS